MLPSCDSQQREIPEKDRQEAAERRQVRRAATESLKVLEPVRGSRFRIGEMVSIRIQPEEKTGPADSAVFRLDGRRTSPIQAGENHFQWDTRHELPGTRKLEIIVYSDGTPTERQELRVVLLPDRRPANYGYRVLNTYPHDPGAYTQGLFYDDGFLYEGTGQYGESSLRKVKLETGEVLKMHRLASELFGEGICLFNDRIVQLTWTSRVGFVYDKATFRVLNKIHYPTQGWGLTTDGSKLIMSDGTHQVDFLEPDYFTELSRIEVYDYDGPVENLNELEYIHGEIWANVFQTDRIVRIDPATGTVTGNVDLTGLLPAKYHHPKLDVLNGIAWDEKNERIFVTGKMWPVLFEIELVER